jgi:ABC-type microcin C transport system duplicated ATPase subunit YejF
MRLIPSPPGRIGAGEVLFEGADLLKLNDADIRAIRGNRIAMIFQEPMSSLNSALSVGLQVAEPVKLHRGSPWARATRPRGSRWAAFASQTRRAGLPPSPTSTQVACANAS